MQVHALRRTFLEASSSFLVFQEDAGSVSSTMALLLFQRSGARSSVASNRNIVATDGSRLSEE